MAKGRMLSGFVCFLAFAVFYTLTARTELQVSDEVATFATGMSLVTQNDLAIDELQWLQDAVGIGKRGPDGHLYAKYFPGNVIGSAILYQLAPFPVGDPFFWNGKEIAPSLARARFAMLLDPLFGALAMTLLWLWTERAHSARVAWTVVVALGVGSDWWYQSRGFMSEVGAGMFLVACAYLAYSRRPYLSALALGLAVLFRPTSLLGMPIWFVSLRPDDGPGRGWRWRDLGSVGLVVAGVIGLGVYNWLRYGAPTDFGYVNETFNWSWLGLWGVLLSPARSPLVYAPVLALAIPGAWWYSRQERWVTLALVTTSVAHILTIGSWHSWAGGWTWGMRLLTPIVPLLAVLCAAALARITKDWRGWALVSVLCVWGFGAAAMGLARDPIRTLNERVGPDKVPFDDTLYTLERSQFVLQYQSLQTWTPCDVDARLLRGLIGACAP